MRCRPSQPRPSRPQAWTLRTGTPSAASTAVASRAWSRAWCASRTRPPRPRWRWRRVASCTRRGRAPPEPPGPRADPWGVARRGRAWPGAALCAVRERLATSPGHVCAPCGGAPARRRQPARAANGCRRAPPTLTLCAYGGRLLTLTLCTGGGGQRGDGKGAAGARAAAQPRHHRAAQQGARCGAGLRAACMPPALRTPDPRRRPVHQLEQRVPCAELCRTRSWT